MKQTSEDIYDKYLEKALIRLLNEYYDLSPESKAALTNIIRGTEQFLNISEGVQNEKEITL